MMKIAFKFNVEMSNSNFEYNYTLPEVTLSWETWAGADSSVEVSFFP